MNNPTETVFGNPNTFAIRYVPGYTYANSNFIYAYCHLVLGGQLIGVRDEPCVVTTRSAHLERIKERLKHNFESIVHEEFNNRNDEELFELVCKSNRMEEQHSPAFAHLPVLENKVWQNCCITFDETTDAWLIAMVAQNGRVKFLWEGWREPCPQEQINKLYSVVVDRRFVVDVMERCLSVIEKEYRNYPVV